MKKAAFILVLDFDHDHTQADINEVKDKLLHLLKQETESGNLPVTGFSIRHETPSITPSWTPDQGPKPE